MVQSHGLRAKPCMREIDFSVGAVCVRLQRGWAVSLQDCSPQMEQQNDKLGEMVIFSPLGTNTGSVSGLSI
ncbi:Hypothetical predicted protein [Cloeon dipterum]|uniref:Uncharacterized protein n=1 Tax=Cloeon dipterum TaxID=197152 RepID=A0A8S1CEU6_9INSE|nr:Hypothetical predicted protein [Cloeon dipterum]